MSKIFIANLKMNFSLQDALDYCSKIAALEEEELRNIIIAAPMPYLAYLTNLYPLVNFASQDVSSINSTYGAFTGEVSAAQVRSCKVNYAIIGHSERRALFHENNETIRQKIINCLNNKIVPVVCASDGESLEKNLIDMLKDEDTIRNSQLIIAYEPLSAIGTGMAHKANSIEKVLYDILKFIKLHGLLAKEPRIVYGGSVNKNSITEILSISVLSGVLVGKAALDSEELIKLVSLGNSL